MKLLNLKLVAILAVVFALSACQKEKAVTPVKNTNGETITSQEARALVNEVTSLHSGIVSMVHDIYSGNGKKNSTNAFLSCGTVIVDSLSSPHTIDIDFGTGCTDENGDFRSGQVHVEYNSEIIRNNGTYMDVTFTHYVDVDREYHGTLGIHNLGPNGGGNPVVELTANLTKYDMVTSETLTANVLFSHEWVTGSATDDNDDDSYLVTGTVTGDDGIGNNFTINVTDPMMVSYAPTCLPVFISGRYTFNLGPHPQEVYYFGDGTCDNIGYQVVNGDTTEFNIAQ